MAEEIECTMCDGYGEVCTECGQSEDTCNCDDTPDFDMCAHCEGKGKEVV